MKKERNAQQTQRRILDATHRILREGGHLSRFSLDTVAKEAGVSKGGLMHHYASKEVLLHAAAQDVIERFEARYQEELAAQTDVAGKSIQAYINAALLSADGDLHEISPILLTFLRKRGEEETLSRFERWRDAFASDDIDPVQAALIRFAVDGMLYTEVIDREPIDAELREKIIARLVSMAGSV